MPVKIMLESDLDSPMYARFWVQTGSGFTAKYLDRNGRWQHTATWYDTVDEAIKAVHVLDPWADFTIEDRKGNKLGGSDGQLQFFNEGKFLPQPIAVPKPTGLVSNMPKKNTVILVKNVPVNPLFPRARPGWHKHVTRVDETKQDGYAFEGKFLREGEHLLPVGSVVIQKIPEEKGHAWGSGVCYVVTEKGLAVTHDKKFDWKTRFLSFRAHVGDMLMVPKPLPFSFLGTEKVPLDQIGQRELPEQPEPPSIGRGRRIELE